MFNIKNRWAYSLWICNVNNLGVWSNSGKSCVKKLCTSLREHAKNIIDFEKKMLPLMKEELRSYQEAKVCHICGKRILKNAKDKLWLSFYY